MPSVFHQWPSDMHDSVHLQYAGVVLSCTALKNCTFLGPDASAEAARISSVLKIYFNGPWSVSVVIMSSL